MGPGTAVAHDGGRGELEIGAADGGGQAWHRTARLRLGRFVHPRRGRGPVRRGLKTRADRVRRDRPRGEAARGQLARASHPAFRWRSRPPVEAGRPEEAGGRRDGLVRASYALRWQVLTSAGRRAAGGQRGPRELPRAPWQAPAGDGGVGRAAWSVRATPRSAGRSRLPLGGPGGRWEAGGGRWLGLWEVAGLRQVGRGCGREGRRWRAAWGGWWLVGVGDAGWEVVEEVGLGVLAEVEVVPSVGRSGGCARAAGEG